MNPDEHVWGHLKRLFRRHSLAANEDIQQTVGDAMEAIKQDRPLVRAFFHHPESEYVRDAIKR
jgi:hypothetical protein